MALFKMAALGVAAYAVWKFYGSNQTRGDSVAFATGESTDGFARSAMPVPMRCAATRQSGTKSTRKWTKASRPATRRRWASAKRSANPPPAGQRAIT